MKFPMQIGLAIACSVIAFEVAYADVACVQKELTVAGYKPGPVDGALGKKTYSAAASMSDQYKLGLAKLSKENSGEWCEALATANDAALVNSEEKFRAQIVGKKLTLDGNWVIIKEDGNMEGNFGKKALAGTWTWEDSYFCRTLTTHSKNTDCQVFRVVPTGVLVKRDKGKGKGFVYQIAGG